MIPTYEECDRYRYDAEAAERPIRFAAAFLRHYEGAFAGKPFTFLPWQEQITRTLFGWQNRKTGLRRFRELYLLTAKGSGKTPWLAAVGLYMLLADGEAAAHVMSCATDFAQAYLTMDAAKKYVGQHAKLARACETKQFEIRAALNKWSVLSGTAEGRHGFRPSCLLMDEGHEWPNGKLYNNLTANATKRQQPLILVATNAGPNEHCFCYQLHKRAVRVRDGEATDDTLLPVIFEASRDLDWTSEAAAKAANPSLGQIYGFDAIKPELVKALESDEGESRYRRLFLSQWETAGDGRWIDLAAWSACEAGWTEPPADAPLFVGMDLAQSDDLCALVRVWPTRTRMYVAAHFWMPRATAEKYERQNSVAYAEWAAGRHITLVDEPTISPAVRRQIAETVVGWGKAHPVKAVCYDRYKADETVAALESAGLTCVPIAQGYSVSPGCHELDRRLKEGPASIVVQPNPVLRFNAENAEAKTDDRGNLWVAKPAAKGRYAGTRWKKVDGITALVTALVEARKHTFPAVKEEWQGTVVVI